MARARSVGSRTLRHLTSLPGLPADYKSKSAFEQSVGRTSLVYLRSLSEETGCQLFGKAEYENPGGSIKDRAALSMILDAEKRGLLTPGKRGTIVEGTAGNTGIGLALCAATRSLVFVIAYGA